ncbi:GSCFA domain-containing protein [Flavobacterium selenitireducens]|uniref:GSCFA domain-containing protein n=1 Tax=Flavobacterium selenitireducens TaxID=2722704 RepID=UPI00168C04DF|nr:GSCFA domain-containing protein [Flavobacterium selenitireducens]MBD3583369.1 GSCFA domain-containing protein [Flavobacterium selenitireducens]
MQFTTPVPISKSGFPISYDSRLFSMGSCFAENIAQKLDHFQFRNVVNPFGILFHPLALEKAFGFFCDGKVFDGSDVFFHNGRWHCFDVHSGLSSPDKESLITTLNQITSDASETLREATHIVITLGTAWVYRNNGSGEFVANCHKVPQREFSKELLAPEAVSRSVSAMCDVIANLNTGAHVIFTISPVRHLKDGFVENQRSKSHLISGLHASIEKRENCHYFPSFEIVMDELRDYRFYASDMIHPNQVAIDYIWERFVSSWIADACADDMSEVDAIRKALAHRPFEPDSEQHNKFRSTVREKIETLRKRLPFLDLG